MKKLLILLLFPIIGYSQDNCKIETSDITNFWKALYQFSLEKREEFWDLIDKIGRKRDLTYLATEGSKVFRNNYNRKGILVELTEYKAGKKYNRIVAETNGHANWIKWEVG